MCNWFGDSTFGTFWTAVSAISTGLAALLGAIAILYSIFAFRRTLRNTHYTNIDTMYMNILQMTLERPYLKTPSQLTGEKQLSEYDTYAYILWNFLESIYDFCTKDKHLHATWYPTIVAESKVHRAWFEAEENRYKFKASFYQFVKANSLPKTQEETEK